MFIKIGSKNDKLEQKIEKNCRFRSNISPNTLNIFSWISVIGAVQKNTNLVQVDIEKMLQIAPLLAIVAADTAENELTKASYK